MKPCLEWDAYPGDAYPDGLHLAVHAGDNFSFTLKVLDLIPARFLIEGLEGLSGSASTVEEAKLAAEEALQKMLTDALEALMEARRKRNREEEFERQAATHLTPEQVAALKVGDEVAIYQDRGDLCWTGVVRSRTPKRGRLRVCGPQGQSELFDDRGIRVSNRGRWHTRYLGPAVPAKEG